jgi:hypothetical protein
MGGCETERWERQNFFDADANGVLHLFCAGNGRCDRASITGHRRRKGTLASRQRSLAGSDLKVIAIILTTCSPYAFWNARDLQQFLPVEPDFVTYRIRCIKVKVKVKQSHYRP